MRHSRPQNEVVLKVKLDARTSFFVECLAQDIASQPATSGSARVCIREALDLLHGDPKAAIIRLNLVLNEALAVR